MGDPIWRERGRDTGAVSGKQERAGIRDEKEYSGSV